MHIEALRNFIHREVLRVLDRRTRRVPCIVDSYNGATHTVKVRLQPEDTLSGWYQIQTLQVGLLAAPKIGSPGWIEFHENDRRAGVFVAAVHNNTAPPPLQIEAGELFYQGEQGQTIYVKSDGSITTSDGAGASNKMQNGIVTATDKAGSTAILDGTGSIDLTASNDLTLTAGTIQLIASAITGGAGATFHKLVTDAMVAFFNSHSHPSNGAPPSQTMGSAQLTSTFTAE